MADKTRGPLAALEEGSFKGYSLKQYPLEGIGQREEIPHYVMFYINLPEKSKYQVERVNGVSGTSYVNRGITRGTETAAFAIGSGAGSRMLPESAGADALDVATVAGAAYVLSGNGLTDYKTPIAAAALETVLNSVKLRPRTNRIVEAIQLYMPDTIMQSDRMDYSSISIKDAMGELRLAQMAAVKAPDIISSVGNALGSTLGAIVTGDWSDAQRIATNAANSVGTDVMGAELAGRLGAASGLTDASLIGALLRSQGVAMNPQIEMIFQQKDFRSFQFDFRFQPRSPEESNIVRDIIATFRRYSAPELANEGGYEGQYYIIPAEFDIEFYSGNSQNEYIPKISSCVLSSVDVNYSQAGQFATFDATGGPPVQIGMTLMFTEVDVITREMVDAGF